MPAKMVTAEEFQALTGEKGGRVYIGPAKRPKPEKPDGLLDKLMSVRWPMEPDPEPTEK